MERNAIQWLGAPCCLRGSFAFYKSFSCRPERRESPEHRQSSEHQDSEGQESTENHEPERPQSPENHEPERLQSTENHGPECEQSTENHGPECRESSQNQGLEHRESSEQPAAVWKLGEFYFIRCGPQDPVCIAELALLWEDRAQRHLLASSRLYYLPEDTPRGRTREHGEDEVLAVSKKMVIRVEDLVSWTCEEPPGWRRRSHVHGTDSCHAPAATSDPGRLKPQSEGSRVRVLSYLQYCRFRSLQRRTQHRPGPPAPRDPHLLALGGLRSPPHTLVLYCRDTFTHPTLDNSTSLWTQLGCTSVSLKGRPRKRRGRDGKGAERSPLGQSESWIERMKENVMGSVEVPWEGGWLPHPEEQPFLDQLYGFMERRGSPISKVPNLGFKKIDLFLLFSVVKRLGGYERVTSERLWKQVYNELGGSPGSTSAATCTRRHYEKLILAYEQHLTGGEAEPPKPLLPSPANRSKELQKAKVTVANQKEKMSSPNGPASQGDPGTKPARKRGRPPSRRNSKPAKKPRAEATPTTLPQATPSPAGLQEGPLNFATTPSAAPLPKPSPEDPCPGQPDPSLPPQPKAEPLSPASLSALTRLHMSGPLGPFALPKGLCPLELFRSRLGLAAVDGGATNPALQPSPVLLLPPKTSTGGSEDPRAGPLPDGGRGEEGEAGREAGREGRPRQSLPPLRILPLDIDCSLQVRQLMRTRLGSSQLTSFARRLTQVLAHDLSKARPSAPDPPPAAPPAIQEQALPLNLSKRCGAKRPAGEPGGGAWHEGGQSQGGMVKWEGPGAVLKHGAGGAFLLEEQDQPADLSCPRRARALLRQHNGQGAGPQGAPGAAAPAPQPPLVNGGDGGGAWDIHPDAETDCRGAE